MYAYSWRKKVKPQATGIGETLQINFFQPTSSSFGQEKQFEVQKINEFEAL